MPEFKKARFSVNFRNNVRCELCPHFCFLKPEEIGKCNVRQNKAGTLITLVYAKPCSIALDPIEKKPLFHFHPTSKTLSIATVGCNLNCKYCQNFEISQATPTQEIIKNPREIVKEAEKNNSKTISYTYTEPTIFYEYMLDIAKLAKEKGIKNVMVSNGFINPLPLKELTPYLDAVNIDLKSIDDKFYGEVCSGKIDPVLKTIKYLKENKVWIELTNLLIPGLNDDDKDIKELVNWIKKELGAEIPLHFSAFYPCFKFSSLQATPSETLKKAREIALESGLKYVYTGNVKNNGGNTYCPSCNNIIIARKLFTVYENKIKEGKCSFCGEKISGVWD